MHRGDTVHVVKAIKRDSSWGCGLRVPSPQGDLGSPPETTSGLVPKCGDGGMAPAMHRRVREHSRPEGGLVRRPCGVHGGGPLWGGAGRRGVQATAGGVIFITEGKVGNRKQGPMRSDLI